MLVASGSVTLAPAWRGCELDSGFLTCVATFYPVLFWVTVVALWAIVVVGFVLWRNKRSL
jgi:hypothetical protein